MASGFGSLTLTDNGRNLLAKAQTGVQLSFTRVAVGDGILNGQDSTKFSRLLDEVLSLHISEIIYSGSGAVTVCTTLDNSNLSEGFYWREIGVFATDPQLGEILYGYANAGAGEIYVPDKGTNAFAAPCNINFNIANADNVTAVIDQTIVYATKQDVSDIESGKIVAGHAENADSLGGEDASTYAPLNSPALTGTPTAPTAAAGTSTTQLATTAFVIGQASTAAPKMDGTAAAGSGTTFARADHVHPTDSTRAPLNSPALTGTPAAPTAAAGTNTTQLATTAFVIGQASTAAPQMDGTAATGSGTTFARADHVHPTDSTRAPLNSPALTGTPAAPTAAAGTNTTQLATTAFVIGQASTTAPQMDGTAATGSGTTFARADHIHPTDTSRAPLNSPALTGTPTAPTAAAGTSTTQLATTAFVAASAATKVSKAGDTMTGPLVLSGDPAANLQAATKQYVDNSFATNDAMIFKGTIDASSSPIYPAGNRGDTYKISAAGKIGGASGINVEVGDMIICAADGSAAGDQATVGANWTIVQANIDGAVVGPTSSASGNIPIFNGATGKVIKDSGYTMGNASGNVPLSNGTTNTNLSADMVDGLHAYTGSSGVHSWPHIPAIGGDGVQDIGKYIDFHEVPSDTADFINRIMSNGAGTLTLNGYKFWHAGNMGSGSGLDADTLDGLDSTVFQKVRTDITGGTFDINDFTLSIGSGPTRQLYVEKTSGGSANISNIPDPGYAFILDVELLRWASTSDYITRQTFVSVYDKIEYVRWCTNGIWSSWEKKWSSSNDGSGSGLDADTVDGYEASDFVRKVALIGSDTSSTPAWYKVCSGTFSVSNDNYDLLFAVSKTFWSSLDGQAGILKVNVRNTNGTLNVDSLRWIACTPDIVPANYIISVSGTSWTLYMYWDGIKYGMTRFELLSYGVRKTGDILNAGSFSFSDNSTPESSAPTITTTSVIKSYAISAGDADTLDSHDSSYFATATQGTKADNALPASSYTAADVLSKLKTVDGSGSGVDADTVDGMQPAAANTASTLVQRDSSGNFSAGTITASLNGTATYAEKTEATASNGSDTDLIYAGMAGSDYFRVRVGGASDAGYVEIATADNGNEPIYIRQYTGVFTTLVRTLTLLDESGNTSFPGTVSGTSFNGVAGLSSSAPNMDGTAKVGTSATAARSDHIHPTDTSRAPACGSTVPLVDSGLNGVVGTSSIPARADHQHPSDETKLDISGGSLLGGLTLNSGNLAVNDGTISASGSVSAGPLVISCSQVAESNATLFNNGGGKMYLGSNGGIDCVNSVNSAWVGISASAFNNTSLEELKQDIKLSSDMLDVVNDSEIYGFRYIDDVKKGLTKLKYGFVIGKNRKTPDQILSDSGESINQYSTISVLWKAVQELSSKVDALQKQVNDLQNQGNDLQNQGRN